MVSNSIRMNIAPMLLGAHFPGWIFANIAAGMGVAIASGNGFSHGELIPRRPSD